MKFVQPIREIEKIEEVKEILKKQSNRNLLMFITGLNTGLRISDILNLKVSDIRNKNHFIITEKKTNKVKRFLINDGFKEILKKYIKNMNDDDYLFPSKKGKNMPIQRIQAYRIINNACRKAGIKDQIGTHTLRKTFGYHHYKQFKDIAILQDIFNHSVPSVTLRYIGINDDIKDQTIREFKI